MSNKNVHLIEPTLHDETGHCCGYVTSLLDVSSDIDMSLELWIGRGGRGLFSQCEKVHPFFYRRWRRFQGLPLLSYLLGCNDSIFIPTAGRLDLLMLDFLKYANRASEKVFLHFHQIKVTPSKLRFLRRIARRHEALKIFAPTAGILNVFKECGFQHCELVPCPTYIQDRNGIEIPSQFNKLVYAGAAREDKGFTRIVALIEYMVRKKQALPFALQISSSHSGHYDAPTQKSLHQLQQYEYSGLNKFENTLTRSDYLNLFKGGICLQVYDPCVYENKFSGVTLDALYNGCPVITTSGTWVGETVSRFDAGIVIDDTSPETLFQAVQKIIEHYPEYHQRALRAGDVLRDEHHPLHTLKAIKKYL